MSKQEIILTSINDHELVNFDGRIYLHIAPYDHSLPKDLDSKNSYLKFTTSVIWPSDNYSFDFFEKSESNHKKIINFVLLGPEKSLLGISDEIKNKKLNIKLSQLKSLYDVFFFSQVYNEETYRWLSTSHETTHIEFLRKIKDIATALNLFKTLKRNSTYLKYKINNILIDNSATNYAYKEGYKIIASNFVSLVYDVERTEKILLPSDKKLIPISFINDFKIENPVHAIIGKNGSGKSHHLKEYIKSYFNDYGVRIINSREIFSRIILISNTIHDKDYTPSKICRNKNKRSNYHLISNTNLKHYNNIYAKGNKITLDGCIEDIIFRELTRSGRFNKALIADEVFGMLNLNIDILVSNSSIRENVHSVSDALFFFRDSKYNHGLNSLSLSDINTEITFRSGEVITALSSGQSTFLVKLLSILMTIETTSLVIIEEPENFLHPSLLIKFMTILKEILIATNSCSVISTHSPLVLRELPKEQVTILSRLDNITSYRTPTIETFAADTTELYQESFSELESKAAYRDEIKKIAGSEPSMESLLKKYSKLPTSLLTKIINEWVRK